MIRSRYSDLELYNLWISGTHIDELCKMAGIKDRKTLYKRFDRLRYRQQNSTNSTEIVENNSNFQTTCLVEVDKVDNSVENVDNKAVENVEENTTNATDTVETEKSNPIALLIVGVYSSLSGSENGFMIGSKGGILKEKSNKNTG